MEDSRTSEPEGTGLTWDLEKGPTKVDAQVDVEEEYLEQPQSSEQQSSGDATTMETRNAITKRLLVDVMKKLDSLNEPVTYTWHNISCFVPLQNKKCRIGSGWCKKNIHPRVGPRPSEIEPKKQILHEGNPPIAYLIFLSLQFL